MNIVLEGPDGGGKSTLADELARLTGMPVIPGEGPAKGPGEITTRVLRYLEYDGVIFDRHPVISHPIYHLHCKKPNSNIERLPRNQVNRFYLTKPFIIYCQSDELSLQNMTVGANEDPEHIAAVRARYAAIVFDYQAWALQKANYIYRFREDNGKLLDLLSKTHSVLVKPFNRGRRQEEVDLIRVPAKESVELLVRD